MTKVLDPSLVRVARAAALLAVDPVAVGGAVLRAPAGPVRDALLDEIRRLLPPGAPWRRLPAGAGDDRLIGGLDLAATLATGMPMVRRGLLAEAHGGVVVAAMAERMEPATGARIAAAIDQGEVVIERDGFSAAAPARFGVIALDEGIEPDEHPPVVLLDRVGLVIDLAAISPRAVLPRMDAPIVAAARDRLPSIVADDAALEALCATAAALGVASMRIPILALGAARANAALAGRDRIEADDLALAAQLVIAPRATRLPAGDEPPPDAPEPPPPEPPQDDQQKADETRDPAQMEKLEDVVLAAAAAAMPEKLLAGLVASAQKGAKGTGRAGPAGKSALRGRPIGTRRGPLRPGARLALVDTLRAAAPWQTVRRRDAPADDGRIHVRTEDFHLRRFRQHAETTTIFVVDASGSAALHRLAEAKGAVELLLADCYVRRDRVALIAFRGTSAEIVLPPTRSLVRAKRSLAGLPGGGGTPLALAIDEAILAARDAIRRGQTPIAVFLTDGRANIDRAGLADRAKALADAQDSAKRFAAAGIGGLVVDTSPRPQPVLRDLAATMRARYVALPHLRAEAVSSAVRALAGGGG